MSNRVLLSIIAVWLAAIVTFHMVSAVEGYPQYRDIHLGTALEYAKGKIDILRPIIVGFNATNTPTPQELPLWQAAAALTFKMLGPWLGWANLVSLLLFASGLWPLFKFTQKYLRDRTAHWTLIFVVSQPLVFLYAGVAGTDGFVLACTIWFLYFADRLLSDQRLWWFVPATIFGALVAVSKLPYFMSAGLSLAWLLLGSERQTWKSWTTLSFVGLCSAGTFFIWSRYCDHVYSLAVLPEVDLRLSGGSNMWFWYFGDWRSRLSLFNWAKGGWAALNSLFGSFALVALAASSLLFWKNRLGRALIFGPFVTTIVFSNLVLVHRHYYLMYSPAIAILCADGMTHFEQLLESHGLRQRLSFALVTMLVLILSTVQGVIGIKEILGYDPYVSKMISLLQEQTSPNDKLLIQGGGWGGDLLFRSGRNGLSMLTTAILEDPQNVARLKELGFNKLVMINESPLLTAAQKIDPGNTRLERLTFQHFISPTPDHWPVIFQSEDAMIKSIP